MNFDDLDTLVAETARGDTSLAYGFTKLAAEAGEVVNEYAESIRGRRMVDVVKVMDELGDVLWCVGHIARCLGYTGEDALNLVNAKLRRRLVMGKDKETEGHIAFGLLSAKEDPDGFGKCIGCSQWTRHKTEAGNAMCVPCGRGALK